MIVTASCIVNEKLTIEGIFICVQWPAGRELPNSEKTALLPSSSSFGHGQAWTHQSKKLQQAPVLPRKNKVKINAQSKLRVRMVVHLGLTDWPGLFTVPVDGDFLDFDNLFASAQTIYRFPHTDGSRCWNRQIRYWQAVQLQALDRFCRMQLRCVPSNVCVSSFAGHSSEKWKLIWKK